MIVYQFAFLQRPSSFSKKIIESSPSTKKSNPQVTSEFYSHQTHQNFIRNSKLDVFHQYCVQYSSFTALATFFLKDNNIKLYRTIRDFTIAKYFNFQSNLQGCSVEPLYTSFPSASSLTSSASSSWPAGTSSVAPCFLVW